MIFFNQCDLEIWRMTLKINRAPLLSHFNYFASFCNLLWIQIGVTVRQCSIWVKIINFSAHVTLKFEGYPKKTRGNLFYVTASFVYHFVAICEFKLELMSRDPQILAKFDLTSVTFPLDLWHWPFAWTSLLSLVITAKNVMMMRWETHWEK